MQLDVGKLLQMRASGWMVGSAQYATFKVNAQAGSDSQHWFLLTRTTRLLPTRSVFYSEFIFRHFGKKHFLEVKGATPTSIRKI